ncbi:protein kinase [Actinomadura barringtoniae]|uniref:non-specific serine/threonine protein kinase n=1 Tax=Actinomadura barringtoniae TaxID=1427535 RepID=A0A939PAN0_9ACTN|nr:serine/threonine-protein kinase [Actinomadura barringtoniae]MBO2449262.1 protein kinase [Actinomadura barringtoniae]
MTPCTQPGCTGTVQADGFCDLCGMAPPVAHEPAPPTTVQPSVANGAAGAGGVPHPAPPTIASAVPAKPYSVAAGSVIPSPESGGTGGSAGSAGSQPSGGSSGSGRTASRGSWRTYGTGSTGAARRGMLGAGLVDVPPVPYRDPASAIMERPEVPENRRYCSRCDEPVGRSREGRPGRTEGFCRSCGNRFSFTPKLQKGELIGGQYEVLGCLAHGGLGWIYLARDHNVSDRWVVLKGLLDTGDADSLAAATAERAFLAEVEHPNIVKIYNFVQHGGTGYIVMEYVGGQSLKDILLLRRKEAGEEGSLPLGQVIAYGLEVLRALGYLHGVGLLYCDFKPDNAIQSEEQLKLIDLGGVRRAFDANSPIFGTPGYQAPEIADRGPSVTSDLYTVGRTLAVLSFPFRGYTGRHLRSLPPRLEVPLLEQHESYYRLLRRATHPDPALRFQSAPEMAEQLTGVLREVLSSEDGLPRPAPSTLFGPERYAAGTEITDVATEPSDPAPNGSTPPAQNPAPAPLNAGRPASSATSNGKTRVLAPLNPAEAAAALPVPLVNDADPAAGFLAGLTARDPGALAVALVNPVVPSVEVSLALARVRIELGDQSDAARLLEGIAAEHPDDWRVDWYRGVAALRGRRFDEAIRIFDDLYDLMPGEMSPKLALAFVHECRGAAEAAAHSYEIVWRTDPTYVSAAFGLVRVRLAAGDRAGAEQVLDSVPPISSHYLAAQLAAVATVVRGRGPGELNANALVEAGQRLETLRLDTERYARFAAEVLEAALAWVRTAPPGAAAPQVSLLGAPVTETALRRKLEATYRLLARLADRSDDRHEMVKRANSVRPRTLF